MSTMSWFGATATAVDAVESMNRDGAGGVGRSVGVGRAVVGRDLVLRDLFDPDARLRHHELSLFVMKPIAIHERDSLDVSGLHSDDRHGLTLTGAHRDHSTLRRAADVGKRDDT
jgi:hypothetical protein